MPERSPSDLERTIVEEAERTRDHFDQLVARLEARLVAMERTEKVALTEIRSLATRVDRLAPHKRTA
jgi:hypothetical protein